MSSWGIRIRWSSKVDLSDMVERERSRSQRYGVSSCFVVFDLSKTLHPVRDAQVLLRILARRVRAADTVGRMTDQQIGLLMPATGTSGAEKVVQEVLAGLPRAAAPTCTVRYYTGNSEVVRAPVVNS